MQELQLKIQLIEGEKNKMPTNKHIKKQVMTYIILSVYVNH